MEAKNTLQRQSILLWDMALCLDLGKDHSVLRCHHLIQCNGELNVLWRASWKRWRTKFPQNMTTNESLTKKALLKKANCSSWKIYSLENVRAWMWEGKSRKKMILLITEYCMLLNNGHIIHGGNYLEIIDVQFDRH